MAPTQLARITNANIIPDIMESVKLEKGITMILNFHGMTANMGEEILPSQACMPPHIDWHGLQAGKFYTLFLTDPDAPSPLDPHDREYLHWLVTDISGEAPDIKKGRTMCAYQPPNPPRHKHRYVAMLFEQYDKGVITLPITNRGRFKTVDYASKHRLDPVPVYVCFWYSSPESA